MTAAIPWTQSYETAIGEADLIGRPDTDNRALKYVVEQSGWDPQAIAQFPGFVVVGQPTPGPVVATIGRFNGGVTVGPVGTSVDTDYVIGNTLNWFGFLVQPNYTLGNGNGFYVAIGVVDTVWPMQDTVATYLYGVYVEPEVPANAIYQNQTGGFFGSPNFSDFPADTATFVDLIGVHSYQWLTGTTGRVRGFYAQMGGGPHTTTPQSTAGLEVSPMTNEISTTLYGILVGALSGGVTNNYGLFIGNVTGTGAYAIKTAAGLVQFGDTLYLAGTFAGLEFTPPGGGITYVGIKGSQLSFTTLDGSLTGLTIHQVSNSRTDLALDRGLFAVYATAAAAANNDTLRGIAITPTFTVGGFTGVTAIGLDIAAVTGGATNYAIKTATGYIQFGDHGSFGSGGSGPVGVGPNALLTVVGTTTVNSFQWGVYSWVTSSVTANNTVAVFSGTFETTAGAQRVVTFLAQANNTVVGTVFDVVGFGVGLTVGETWTGGTNNYGLRICKVAGGTNNFGIWLGDVTTGNAYAILTNKGYVLLSDAVAIGSNSMSFPNVAMLSMTGTHAATSTFGRGIYLIPVAVPTMTTFHYGIEVGLHAQAGAYTIATGIVLHVLDAAFTAGNPTMTTQYGLKIEDLTKGASNFSIFTGRGTVSFGDEVNISSPSPKKSALNVTNVGDGTNSYGASIQSRPVTGINGSRGAAIFAFPGHSSGTVSQAIGVVGEVTWDRAGSIALAAGVLATIRNYSSAGTGTVVTGYGVVISGVTNTGTALLTSGLAEQGGGGDVTNLVGLYVGDVIARTDPTPTAGNFAIWTNGGLVSLGDGIRFRQSSSRIIVGASGAADLTFKSSDDVGQLVRISSANPVLYAFGSIGLQGGITFSGVNQSISAVSTIDISGTNQGSGVTAVNAATVGTTALTGAFTGLNVALTLASGAYTLANFYGVHISQPAGAPTAVTNLYGLKIENLAAIGGGTVYAIKTGNPGMIWFTDTVAISSSNPPIPSTLLYMDMGFATGLSNVTAMYVSPAGTTSVTAAYRGIHIAMRMANGAYTTANLYCIHIMAPTGTPTAVTNLYGLKIDDLVSVGGGTTYAIFTGTGKVQFGDSLSLPNPAKTIGIGIAATDSGVDQRALRINYNPTSAATGAQYGASIVIGVPASTTVANVYNLYISSTALNSGSVVTVNYGLYIESQTTGGTNYAIFTNAGLIRFGSDTTIVGHLVLSGPGPTTGNVALAIGADVFTGSGNNVGINCAVRAPNPSTGLEAIRAQVMTLPAAYTVGSLSGIRIADATKGAGSTISLLYGLLIDPQTTGDSCVGISIGSMSGTADSIALAIQPQNGGVNQQFGIRIYGIGGSGGSIGIGISIDGVTRVATTNYGLTIGNITGAGTNYAIYTNAGLVRFGDPVTISNQGGGCAKLTVLAGNGAVGIGIAADVNVALYLGGTFPSTANLGAGMLANAIIGVSNTTGFRVVDLMVNTQATTWTMASGVALYVRTPTKGAGSNITTVYGLYIESQQAGSSGNFAIFTNIGQVAFGGTSADGGVLVSVGGNYANIGGGSDQRGIEARIMFSQAATGAASGIKVGIQTVNQTFTVPNMHGVYIESALKGAASTITTLYGLRIDDQTVGATNYAIFTGLGTVRFGDSVNIAVTAGTSKGLKLNGVLNLYQDSTGKITLDDPSTSQMAANGAVHIGVTASAVEITGNAAMAGATSGSITLRVQQNGVGVVIASPTQTAAGGICLDIATTWNAGAVAFTAIRMTITNTASAATSRMLDFIVGATSTFAVTIAGAIQVAGNQVVSTRKTGWTPWTGTAVRTTFNADTATTLNVAQALKALIDDLHATAGHGLIGT